MAALKSGWQKLPSRKKNELIEQLIENNNQAEERLKELQKEVDQGFKLLKQTEKTIAEKREKIFYLIGNQGYTPEEASVIFDKVNAELDAFYDKNAK